MLLKPDREKHLEDLKTLLSLPKLGEWGMDALNDTLKQLIPELQNCKQSTIVE